MISSLSVSWEAVYNDGHVDRETEGVRYGDIDRSRLASFHLVSPGEVLCSLFANDGRSGWNLVYRRRTIRRGTEKTVWFIVGWVPNGPIHSIQPETMQAIVADRFHGGGGPLGMVVPIPEEGEHWDLQHLFQKSDAVLYPNQIVLPSGFVMNTPHLNDGRHGRKGQ